MTASPADAGGNRFETILLERRGRVALVQLNRPKALNALNSRLMAEVTELLAELDTDPGVGAIILTGSERAFAAGADIKEMQSKTFAEVFTGDLFAPWDSLSRLRTPTIAAVSGYALGGGCELAMLCDVLLAADTAVFGQPEVKLGVIPGIGVQFGQQLGDLGHQPAVERVERLRPVQPDQGDAPAALQQDGLEPPAGLGRARGHDDASARLRSRMALITVEKSWPARSPSARSA